eukprot:3255276-Ditylum_brightwellii.AAC.1
MNRYTYINIGRYKTNTTLGGTIHITSMRVPSPTGITNHYTSWQQETEDKEHNSLIMDNFLDSKYGAAEEQEELNSCRYVLQV